MMNRIRSNFATLGAVATHTFTVPKGRNWRIMGWYAERDVNATIGFHIEDADGNMVYQYLNHVAGVSNLFLPRDMAEQDRQAFKANQKIGPQWTFIITWGAAQTTPEVALWVEETQA